MSAQQNQLKDLTEEDYHAFISLYSYTPVGNTISLYSYTPVGNTISL